MNSSGMSPEFLDSHRQKPIRDMTEPELGRLGNQIGRILENSILPPATGFVTIFFDSTDSVGQYVSNCERDSIIKLLRETADRLESREDVLR